ncbi:MAG: DUF4391 domain-containing protein, partial [Desulfovibrionaceae bacterium]|nr:DUF4391 domain-containing protein [Desulfovibrionaceae bacterium]
GKQVMEIEVIQIVLRRRGLDASVLELIDREIPYHLVFLLQFQAEFQAYIGYKEASGGKSAFKLNACYCTPWLPWAELPLSLQGLNMDAIYENFIRQIAGESLAPPGHEPESLQEAVERDRQRQALLRQIAALEKKLHQEKQFNRQVELNARLKKLRSELETL